MTSTPEPGREDLRDIASRIAAGLDASTGSLIILLDEAFTVLWASRAASGRIGGPEILVGANALDFLHPHDIELAAAAVEHHSTYAEEYATPVADTPPQPSTIRVRDIDDNWMWAEITLHNRLADPEIRAIVAHMRIDSDRPLLAHAVELLSENADLAEILTALADVIDVQLVGSTAAIVWWEGTTPKVATSSAVNPGTRVAHGIAPVELCKRVRRSEKTLIVDDLRIDAIGSVPAATAGELGARQLLVIPVHGTTAGDIVASAVIWSPSTVPPLLGKQVPIALTLELISLAITDNSLKQRLRADAEADPLTGVLNRAGFRSRLAEAVAFQEYPLGVVFLDIDDFKAVNDRYGHLAGDRVLLTLAARLSDLDPRCVVGRMGGDEFALLGPTVGGDEIAEIAERAVYQARRPIAVTTDSELTASITAGYAVASADHDASTLLARADDALMAGKRTGKAQAVGDGPG